MRSGRCKVIGLVRLTHVEVISPDLYTAGLVAERLQAGSSMVVVVDPRTTAARPPLPPR